MARLQLRRDIYLSQRTDANQILCFPFTTMRESAAWHVCVREGDGKDFVVDSAARWVGRGILISLVT